MPADDKFFDLPSIILDDAEFGTREYATLQWLNARLTRGIKFIESQVGYDKIARAIDEIFAWEKSSNATYAPTPRPTSQTRVNLVADIAEDVTAMLTDTRCFWNYTTQNPKYKQQTDLANKSAKRWYSDHLVDLRIGDVIRYYTIAGTGVAHLYYSRELDEMVLEAEDPRQVFPVDPLTYHTFQTCKGVITRRPRTPDWVKDEYGKVVAADIGGTAGGFFGWLQRTIDGPGERGGPLSKKSNADKQIPHTPTTFVNTMYLRDKRRNTRKDMGAQFTNQPVRMGKWIDNHPATPWSYEVPVDGPLFPFGRMCVWTQNCLLEDGPSWAWHGQFPLIKFTLNPWPMSWFGKAPVWDCIPLNDSINGNLRVIDDHYAQVAQPGVVADRNVARSELNKVNTRAPGMKVKTNLASGKGIQVVNPPPLEPLIMNFIEKCEQWMQKLAGVADPSAMANLAQIPSDDTIDTLMKAMTPGVRLRSRILEGAYKELAQQFLYSTFEFDTLAKRVAEFGPAGATKEDFDYSPNSMIPDDVPSGEPGDNADAALGLDNPRPLYQRAQTLLASIVCEFDPSSLLNTAAQQDLMKYFLLAKMGYVSVFTIMEKMGLNFAPPSLVIPSDEIGRLQLQQALGIGMVANAQGRKATDQAPPSMAQNANGPTIATS